MGIYGDVGTVDDSRNLILLRSDLHSIFDARNFARNFAIVLKPLHALEKPVFVVHALLGRARSEMVQLYHNVPLQPLMDIAVEFLFARFAWTIIRSANNFLGGGVPRALRVRNGEEYKTEIFSAPKCMELGKPIPSGSTSPKKRKAPTESGSADLEEELEEDSEEDSEEGLDLEVLDKRLDLEALDKRLEALEDFDFGLGACQSRKRQRTKHFDFCSIPSNLLNTPS